MFIEPLTSVANASNHTKCLSLNKQQCMNQTNEYSQGLRYYPFAVNIDRCVQICIIIDGLSNRVCAPNKTEDLNLSIFNIITEINESEILTKHIPCKCYCTFDGRKCNSNQKWDNDEV